MITELFCPLGKQCKWVDDKVKVCAWYTDSGKCAVQVIGNLTPITINLDEEDEWEHSSESSRKDS
jgi:hypothetical protein